MLFYPLFGKCGVSVDHVAAVGGAEEEIAARWGGFAEHFDAVGAHAYARIARGVAEDGQVVGLLAQLPAGNKRQPNLLLGAVRYLGGPVESWPGFRAFVLAQWERVRAVVLERLTQTNEARRCAVLLPVLAQLPGPLALLEVGSSAGLCLYPDRYRYRFGGGGWVGPDRSAVGLECAVSGPVPVPERVPQVVWRGGVDLNPLDPGREQDVRWLESLIWPGPEEEARRERLRGAAAVAAAEPAQVVAGDLVQALPELASRVPREATLVVFHSAVAAYLPSAQRDAFVQVVRSLPGHWVSNEGWKVFPWLQGGRPPREGMFTVALDERVVAYAGEHGQEVVWA
ncbi:hypothetical protein GCM10007147_29720 [Nocardiopsis kunsanensis]|uniref:DUF2332 domain-containing protein n=1 Tax=Nocardiopsis kunsanensis TaxID=141693 RepID=A0A918XFA1_9ACTN|nr:hypothetical protein GCM10007147_29720 [Nocardiopsis kunsanensis]